MGGLEKYCGRAALVAGTLAGEAALGFGSLGRSQRGEFKQLNRCDGGERRGCASRGCRRRLREAWADGAEGGCIGRTGETHGAVVSTVAAAAGGEVRVGSFSKSERWRDDREAKGG